MNITGNNASENLNGTNGNDRILGNGGRDAINAGAGNDQVFGGAGNDVVNGSSGNDQLFGGAGNDLFIGGSGSDTAYILPGFESVSFGRNSSNSIFVQSSRGRDVVRNDVERLAFGEDGTTALFNPPDVTFNLRIGTDGNNGALNGTNGRDLLFGLNGNDVISGGRGRDQLFGGNGDDILNGGLDNDVLFGGRGNDLFIGGGSNDVAVIDDRIEDVDLSIRNSNEARITSADGQDLIRQDVEFVEFSRGDSFRFDFGSDGRNDNIRGSNSANDLLIGGDGADRLDGRGGNDVFDFTRGDQIFGGAGFDTVIIDSNEAGFGNVNFNVSGGSFAIVLSNFSARVGFIIEADGDVLGLQSNAFAAPRNGLVVNNTTTFDAGQIESVERFIIDGDIFFL